MTEPRYVPVLPRGPVRLPALPLRAAYDAGGRWLLWREVRRLLVDTLGPRASSPEEVAALRAWIDLEQRPTFDYFLRRFEPREQVPTQ